MQQETGQQRFVRGMAGIVLASGLVYPLLLCAVQLLFVQLVRVDAVAVGAWLSTAVVCSVAAVAVLRWGAARPVRSPWLLAGLAPPAVFELWLFWPALTG